MPAMESTRGGARASRLTSFAPVPTGFEIGEIALLRAIIGEHPSNQRDHDQDRRQIARDDERDVRRKLHGQAPCASRSRKVRTRRRRISLRMAARCSVTKSSVNATVMTISGVRMAG